jgi:hypothetical protein
MREFYERGLDGQPRACMEQTRSVMHNLTVGIERKLKTQGFGA